MLLSPSVSNTRQRTSKSRRATNSYQMPLATVVDVDPLHRHRYIERIADALGGDKSYAEKIDTRLMLLCHRNAEAYMEKCTQIVYNLQAFPSLALQYDPEILISLDDLTLDPSSPALLLRELRQQREKGAQALLELMTKEDARDIIDPRSSIRCARCKSYDLDIDCKQTRGADEAMTIFCKCRNPECGASWS